MIDVDVVLIGSGISSLTCGALLAKKGRSVCVLERYAKPGGYLHGFRRFDHNFDTGAHYIGAMYPGQPFRQLLEYLGIYNDSLFVPLDREAFDVMKFPNREVKWAVGYQNTIEEMCSQFPKERKAIETFFSEVQHAVTHFQTYKFRSKVDQNQLMKYLEIPLSQVVESLTQNEELMAVLYAHCLLHAVRPTDVAFGIHSIMLDSFISGPVGFGHGGDALADTFVNVIEKAGGSVLLRASVVKMENQGDEIQKLLLSDGREVRGKWVISGIHPKNTFSLLSDDSVLRPVFKRRLAQLEESTASFGIYADCEGHVPLHPRRNYFYFSEPGMNGLFDVPTAPVPPRVVFANVANRNLSEDDHKKGLNILAVGPYSWFREWEKTRVGHRGEEYNQLKKSYSEMIWDLLDQHNPGIKLTRRQEVTSTALTNVFF